MGKELRHYRLASKAMGDDTTLTRYVRNDGNHTRQKQRQPRLPGLESDFIREGRTRFGVRVLRVDAMPHLLVSGHNNIKIGRDVRKGRLKGYWIYTLSLEERKTCPSSCQHWQSCYGNNMPYAKRVDHTDPAFLPTLEAEIAGLLEQHKGRVLIRLHALGDFYSIEYVRFWRLMLMRHHTLAVFGYTAREPDSEIGWAVRGLCADFGDRCMLRFSNADWPIMATVTIGTPESRPENAFICPEQTRQTQCCATCGLCWSTRKNVAFLEH